MDAATLKIFLISKGVDEETANILEEQSVDEGDFQKITDDEMKELNIKLGPRKKLQKLQFELAPVVNVEFVDMLQPVSNYGTRDYKYPVDRDLRAVILERPDGAQIIETLSNNHRLSTKDRHKFANTLIDDLVAHCSVYPQTRDKETLARRIVTQFPQLASTIGNVPEALFFHAKGSPNGRTAAGKIETRLEHLRTFLPPHLKRNISGPRQARSSRIVLPSTDDVLLQIDENASINEVKSLMERTLQIRNDMRQRYLPAKEILLKFPRLNEFNGQIIDHEFDLMAVAEENISNFENFKPKLYRKFDFYSNTTDDFLRALQILKFHLSVKGPKISPVVSQGQKEDFKYLILWLNAEDDIDGVVETSSWLEPFIIIKPDLDQFHQNYITLIIDKHQVPLGYEELQKGFDVNRIWSLPNFVCDFYIAMDVICSTSSIFNLVAISIDRYIAVTQPIKYAKHKNSRRVCLTILLVWAISAAIGSPIVLGLNYTEKRDPDLCVFYNTDFIMYSSLSSFYIPCIIMVFLYWNIFKALRARARKQKAAKKSHLSDLTTGGSIIENIAVSRKIAETTLGSSSIKSSKILPDEERPTNTASGSNEEEDENAGSPELDDCHVIINDKSTEFMLATVVEETGNVVAQISTQQTHVISDPNGNHDSGYVPSNVEDVIIGASTPVSPKSPRPPDTAKRNGTNTKTSFKKEPLSVSLRPLSLVRSGVQALQIARNDSTLSTNSKGSRKDKKNLQDSRFTIYKVHKASKKKREKSSAKKERKATKTLAIVLGVFLICWVPFFTCNIMDGMCSKLDYDCSPGVTAFILTTWLGYMNSFVNPIIYTIFNPEFRKAFKKIMHL